MDQDLWCVVRKYILKERDTHLRPHTINSPIATLTNLGLENVPFINTSQVRRSRYDPPLTVVTGERTLHEEGRGLARCNLVTYIKTLNIKFHELLLFTVVRRPDAIKYLVRRILVSRCKTGP